MKIQNKFFKKNKNEGNELIDLNDKVDAFIQWYFDNMVKDYYNDIGEYNELNNMRNFIEKMAVWYELRYPDYEVNRLMPGSGQERMNINDVMFSNNQYINTLLDENSDIRQLDWDEFYNANTFIKSLPWEERRLFLEPKYNSVVYFNRSFENAHLHLTKNGIVRASENVSTYTHNIIRDEQLVGLHLNEVIELFKEKGIKLPENNELEEELERVNKLEYQKDEMLNCVMYRIIERGGVRIGPRRAFLFAKEFDRNIDVPMKYVVDYTDPGLRLFMNEYIKAGGSKDLVCYQNYFCKTGNVKALDTVTFQELLLTKRNDAVSFYTPEETELHQQLVNALAFYIDADLAKKEEIDRKRLERKSSK